MRRVILMMLIFLAGLLVGAMVAGGQLVVDARGLDTGLWAAVLVLGAPVGLVLIDESFSRYVEAWLASWRACKSAGRRAWRGELSQQGARLGLEELR